MNFFYMNGLSKKLFLLFLVLVFILEFTNAKIKNPKPSTPSTQPRASKFGPIQRGRQRRRTSRKHVPNAGFPSAIAVVSVCSLLTRLFMGNMPNIAYGTPALLLVISSCAAIKDLRTKRRGVHAAILSIYLGMFPPAVLIYLLALATRWNMVPIILGGKSLTLKQKIASAISIGALEALYDPIHEYDAQELVELYNKVESLHADSKSLAFKETLSLKIKTYLEKHGVDTGLFKGMRDHKDNYFVPEDGSKATSDMLDKIKEFLENTELSKDTFEEYVVKCKDLLGFCKRFETDLLEDAETQSAKTLKTDVGEIAKRIRTAILVDGIIYLPELNEQTNNADLKHIRDATQALKGLGTLTETELCISEKLDIYFKDALAGLKKRENDVVIQVLKNLGTVTLESDAEPITLYQYVQNVLDCVPHGYTLKTLRNREEFTSIPQALLNDLTTKIGKAHQFFNDKAQLVIDANENEGFENFYSPFTTEQSIKTSKFDEKNRTFFLQLDAIKTKYGEIFGKFNTLNEQLKALNKTDVLKDNIATFVTELGNAHTLLKDKNTLPVSKKVTPIIGSARTEAKAIQTKILDFIAENGPLCIAKPKPEDVMAAIKVFNALQPLKDMDADVFTVPGDKTKVFKDAINKLGKYIVPQKSVIANEIIDKSTDFSKNVPLLSPADLCLTYCGAIELFGQLDTMGSSNGNPEKDVIDSLKLALPKYVTEFDRQAEAALEDGTVDKLDNFLKGFKPDFVAPDGFSKLTDVKRALQSAQEAIKELEKTATACTIEKPDGTKATQMIIAFRDALTMLEKHTVDDKKPADYKTAHGTLVDAMRKLAPQVITTIEQVLNAPKENYNEAYLESLELIGNELNVDDIKNVTRRMIKGGDDMTLYFKEIYDKLFYQGLDVIKKILEDATRTATNAAKLDAKKGDLETLIRDVKLGLDMYRRYDDKRLKSSLKILGTALSNLAASIKVAIVDCVNNPPALEEIRRYYNDLNTVDDDIFDDDITTLIEVEAKAIAALLKENKALITVPDDHYSAWNAKQYFDQADKILALAPINGSFDHLLLLQSLDDDDREVIVKLIAVCDSMSSGFEEKVQEIVEIADNTTKKIKANEFLNGVLNVPDGKYTFQKIHGRGDVPWFPGLAKVIAISTEV